MKNKIGLVVLSLFCQFCVGQTLTRKPVLGQVVNDSIPLENGVVFNINSKTGSVIKPHGYFSILAKDNDTLVISSLAFKSKKIILTKKLLALPLLRVKLEAYTNQLLEVFVYSKKIVHPVEGNTQKYVDQLYSDDEKSSPKNIAMPADGTIEKGMDFVRIYKDVFKILKKNNPEKTDFASEMNFTEVAMKRVSYAFFTNTLNLKDDEISLFLVYCENDSKSRTLLKPESEFQLMDFLIIKNKEFKRIITFGK